MTTLTFDALWRDRGVSRGLRGISKDADKAHGSFKNLGTGGRAQSAKLAGGLGILKGGAAGAAVALGAAGAAGLGFGLKVASGNEQARISFTTMLGSAAKADKFLKGLQKFAATTPFEFPELQTAASSLISAGINANKVIPIMRTLGDVTSGMGTGSEGVRRATVALQQMNAAGRITGEDLNQLRDAGIPVYDLLAKATGKSKAEVVKLAQAGKLGQKELSLMMKALESGEGLERFSGLMEKQSKSLSGMWSTLKDMAGQGLAEVIGAGFPLLKQAMGGVTDLLESIGKWVKDNRDEIGGFFRVVGDAAGTFGRVGKAAFKTFFGSITDGKATFADFSNFVQTHQEQITAAIVMGAKVTVAFGIAIAQVASAGIKSFGAFYTVFSTNAKIMIGSMGKILEAATWAFGWIPGIGEKLKSANAGFKSFSAAAVAGMDRTSQGIKGASGWIDNALIPSLKKSGKSIDEVGRKEIIKAATRDSLRRTRGAVEDATKSIKENGKTLDVNSEKGRRNRASLKNLAEANRDYIRKLEQNGASTRKVDRATDNARATFIKTARSMGASERQAKDLANKFGLLDKRIDTISNRHVKIKFSTQSFSIGGVKYKVNTTSPSAVGRSGSRAEVAGHPSTQLIPPPHGGGPGNPYVDVGVAKMPKNTLTQPGIINRWSKQYADEGGKLLAKAVAKKIEESFVGVGGNGGLGPQGKGMAAAIRAGRRLGANSIGTYPGHHPSMAKARDFMISSRGEGNNIAAHMRSNARQYGIWYVIWNRRIASRTYPGMPWRAYTRSNPHTDHVHVSWYDKGGMLKPGGAGVNASGQPERVLSPAQTKNFDHLVKVMDRNQGAVNVHNHYHFDKYIGSKDELIQFLSTAKRQGRLDVILR